MDLCLSVVDGVAEGASVKLAKCNQASFLQVCMVILTNVLVTIVVVN